eukprot:6464551-Amphidinium_carterae.1
MPWSSFSPLFRAHSMVSFPIWTLQYCTLLQGTIWMLLVVAVLSENVPSRLLEAHDNGPLKLARHPMSWT